MNNNNLYGYTPKQVVRCKLENPTIRNIVNKQIVYNFKNKVKFACICASRDT